MAYLKPGSKPPKKGKGSKLSPKMQMFVEHLLADPDRNASRAVLAAGYKTNNKNRMATELLRHPLIKQKIDEADRARRERMEFSADFLLNKLMRIINDPDIKTNDQLRAIELAGKSIALWKERQEISGPDGKAIETQQRLEENVRDFTTNLKRLASKSSLPSGDSERGGEGKVVEFPKRSGEGGA